MKTEIFGVKFDNYTINESVNKAIESLVAGHAFFIVTPNPEIVNLARKDRDYKRILNSADIVTPDGIGIVYASRILHGNIKERAAGFDITCGIIEKLNEIGGKVFLFGGKPGVAQSAADKIKAKYNNICISGIENGYFDDDRKIIQNIKDASPDLLLVCLGAPKQEKWIYKNINNVNSKIIIGAGGSLDVLAGNSKRAPEIFIKLGMEWFYRLIKEPWRFNRMIKLPLFLMAVIFKGGKDNER